MIPENGIGGTGQARSEAAPPALFVARAARQARFLERCVYLYRSGATWLMTTHLGGLPRSMPVWAVPAGGTVPERMQAGGF